MIRQLLIILVLVIAWEIAPAQWSIQPGIGVANPITGYATIVRSGPLLQLDATRKLNNPHWELGLMLGWGRMHNDQERTDPFPNARLDQVPMLVFTNYQFSGKKFFPYAGMGLGVSLYNLSYDPTPTTGETINNVSFSIMPRLGLRIPAGKKVYPFIEVNAPLVMDGPPIGVDKGEKITGYIGAAAGAAYHF